MKIRCNILLSIFSSKKLDLWIYGVSKYLYSCTFFNCCIVYIFLIFFFLFHILFEIKNFLIVIFVKPNLNKTKSLLLLLLLFILLFVVFTRIYIAVYIYFENSLRCTIIRKVSVVLEFYLKQRKKLERKITQIELLSRVFFFLFI